MMYCKFGPFLIILVAHGHVNVLRFLMSRSDLSKSLGVEEASSARASSGPLLRTGRGSARIPKLEIPEFDKYQEINKYQ